MILYAEFRSARTAPLVMANLPLALDDRDAHGARSASPRSWVSSPVGIATRNGILLVSHYLQLLGEGVPFRVILAVF
ncbi:MAG: hypothetical protein WKF55_02300 [Gemmatimonadaceae bacterium]